MFNSAYGRLNRSASRTIGNFDWPLPKADRYAIRNQATAATVNHIRRRI